MISPVGVSASSLGGVKPRYNGDIGKLRFLVSGHRRTGTEGWRRRASRGSAYWHQRRQLTAFAQRLSSVPIRAVICTALCATAMPTKRRCVVFTLVTKYGLRCWQHKELMRNRCSDYSTPPCAKQRLSKLRNVAQHELSISSGANTKAGVH